mgnify:CR=1 FL=1
MEIRIDKKYDYDPQNDHIKVLCSVLEDGQIKLTNIIAKPRIESFDLDLQEQVGQKYAEFLSQELEKQKNITFVSTIEEGTTIELKSEDVEKLVVEIKGMKETELPIEVSNSEDIEM